MSADAIALVVFATFYGPLLLVIALAVHAWSLGPAGRGASRLARWARSPLFWAWLPSLLAAVIALVLAVGTTAPAEALASGPAVTLTKTTTTHFTQAGATLSRYVDSSNDQLTLFSNLSPSTAMTLGPLMPYVDGDGAHAIESAIGEFLIIHGEKQNVSSVLTELTATTLAGPTFNDGATPTPTQIGVAKGAFSIARGDGTFLLIVGGDTDAQPTPPAPQLRPLATQVITPAASLGGTWTAAPGPNLSGTTGAGLGAHADKFSVNGVNRFLIVHAGGGVSGTPDTSIYTPPQCQNGIGSPPACTGGTFIAESMVAGPAITLNKKGAQGALSIPRGDGTFFVVLGGGGNDTQIYTPPTTLAGIGSFAVGPTLGNPASDGTFAIQYKNAANQDRYAIVRGGSNAAVVYDPNATPATSAGVLGSLSIPAPSPARGGGKVGAGASGFLRPDGTVVGFYGSQETLAYVLTPGASSGGADLANNGAFTALNLTNSLPMDRGSFVLHQHDGRMLIFGGSAVETRYNDAGWALSGTYESEPMNAGDLDQWNSISWTRGPDDLKLEWRAAKAKDLLANATYATIVTSGGQTGTAAISPGTTNKWIQVRVSFKRAGTASTGAQASVWLGSSSVVQRRALTSNAPTLFDFSLGYTAGVFVLSARSPETAGVGFPLTVELRDSANARIVDYQGNHTLTFSGANVAPDGVSKPTVRDRSGADVAFGQPTALTFESSGLGIATATRRTTLYKKEEVDVTASETVTFPGPSVAFTLSTHTMTTGAAAHMLVNAAGPSATKSTLVASPAVVKPNGSDASTLTLTITDAFGNVLPGLEATLASDRAGADTFSRTTLPPSDFSGKSTATVVSSTRGTANVTATVLGPPTDVAVPQRFFGTAVTAFRAGPVGSTLWQAPVAAPATASLATTLSYGATSGSRQVIPGTASSVAGNPGASATNKGWRDESYARASQATTAGRLSGDWTFTYSLALTTGTQPVTAQTTVVAYAVDAGNTAREMFRSTSGDLLIGPAELNYAQTFTPSYAVLNGVAGYLAAGEVLQYELFLSVSQNPNSSSGSVVQFRAGSAGTTLAPPDVEAGAISDLPSTIQQTALTPATRVFFFGGAAPITLSKTTASHFAAGTPGAGVTTSAAGISLAGTPATSITTATLPSAAGEGAHTLQGNGGELLIVQGNGSTATSVYAPSGTVSAGPTVPSPVGKGAFSFPISGGYLLVAGGGTDPGAQPLATYIVTLAAVPGGTWTIAAGPSLSGTTGAGLGAHAIKYTVAGTTKFLVIHGGATGKTSVYSTATGLFAPGPDLVIPATGLPGLPLGAAGAGAHAFPRPDGKSLIVLGNGTTGTNVFDPASGGDGSFVPGPTLSSAVGAGGHAIQYRNASALSRALIVAGNGTAATMIYDPAAAVGAGISAGPTLPSAVTTGGSSVLRGDGSAIVLAGGGTAAAVFTPSTESAAAVTIAGLPAIGAGAHAFQRGDGRFVVVAGGASTAIAVYDAGWSLAGTYETEGLDPANVDHWDAVSWTISSGGTLTVSARAATTQAGLASATYTDVAVAQPASGSGPIGGAVGSRWVQVKLALARSVPASVDAQAGVWLGGSSLVQDRSRGPFVTRVALDYLSGAYSVSATATGTAGTTNVATITLRDSAGTLITDLAGSHTLVLSGAGTAPNGAQPTATTPTSAGPATVTFGGATALAFTAGTATTTLTLYKAETASVSVSETVAASAGGTFDLTAYTTDVNGPAQIAVSAAAAAAAKSTATAAPTSVPADNATVSTISVRVKDQFENPVVGLTTLTLSSFASVAGDRAGLDTLTNPATTDATGLGTGTIRSTRSGTVTIAVSVGGSPLAIASPPTVTFTAATFTVVTQHTGTETAGVPFTLTITAKDASGTTVTSYAGSKTIAFTTTARARTTPVAGPSAIVTTPQLITFTAGVATTSSLTGSACNQPAGIACAFTLYNTAQTPTITATDGAFPTGTSAPITVVPAAPSLTVSTFVADPLVVAPDSKDTSNLTVQVMDAFGNPISGKTVTFSSSRTATDTFFQPIGLTGADGIAIGQITSQTVGTPTVSAAITGVGTLSTTQVINFVQPGGATRVLIIRTQHVEQETAGVAFSITVIGIQADGTVDKTFCGASSCSITITNSATAAPDGTVPTGTLTRQAPNFQNGQYTTNAGDGNLITFFRANQQPTPIITVNVVSPNASIIGVTPPILVQPGPVNLAKSYVYAVPDLVPADGTTSATLGAKVLDTWKNPISARSVTFASSRGVSDVVVQPAAPTGALGIVFGGVTSSVASQPGVASTFATITGTVTGVGQISGTATVTFFGSPGGGRIQNGTRPGAVVNGAATDFTLALVARDLEGLELPADSLISWSVRGQGDGTFTTTTTTSGPGTLHATQFTTRRAGRVTITAGYLIPSGRVGAGTQVAIDLSFTIVSQFDIAATTLNGRVVTARIEWDGTTLRTVSWTTQNP